MDISVSISNSSDMWHHTNFNVFKASFPLLLSKQWSPIVWKDGIRKGDNFIYSDALVLDFDDGIWTIDDAITFCKLNGYAAIIGATKHHRLPKDKHEACDRYRLIIPWIKRIECRKTFEANMKRIVAKFPCDQLAVDSARSYRPCREIVYQCSGRRMPWFPYKQPKKKKVIYNKTGILPGWLLDLMQESPAQGLRNRHAFRLAAKLAEHGFTEQQCIDTVVAAPIDLPLQEKKDCAKSGYKAGRDKR